MLSKKIKEMINKQKTGWVFTHTDFKYLGNLSTIERVLSRLVSSNKIKRIRRGIYYIPEVSLWGEVPPATSNIIKALERNMNTKFIPDGANALHQIGLTPQVPMKQTYITDRQINTISVGNTNIYFRKVSPKKLLGASNGTATYFSAIEYLGKEEINQKDIQKQFSYNLNKDIAENLTKEANNRAVWIQNAVKNIVEKVI
jgi:predicted transcriptional regulator of viral defense system